MGFRDERDIALRLWLAGGGDEGLRIQLTFAGTDGDREWALHRLGDMPCHCLKGGERFDRGAVDQHESMQGRKADAQARKASGPHGGDDGTQIGIRDPGFTQQRIDGRYQRGGLFALGQGMGVAAAIDRQRDTGAGGGAVEC